MWRIILFFFGKTHYRHVWAVWATPLDEPNQSIVIIYIISNNIVR